MVDLLSIREQVPNISFHSFTLTGFGSSRAIIEKLKHNPEYDVHNIHDQLNNAQILWRGNKIFQITHSVF
jgi:hypothetical protein